MPIIHSPKRWGYVVLLGILLAPLGVAMGLGVGAIVWSFIVIALGIAGDADYINENLDVKVRRWKWVVAAVFTSVFTGIFYLYQRRAWFDKHATTKA